MVIPSAAVVFRTIVPRGLTNRSAASNPLGEPVASTTISNALSPVRDSNATVHTP